MQMLAGPDWFTMACSSWVAVHYRRLKFLVGVQKCTFCCLFQALALQCESLDGSVDGEVKCQGNCLNLEA